MARRLLLAAALGLLPPSPALAAGPMDDEMPTLDLLEFLGSWEDADGEWIDPLTLLDEMEAGRDAPNPNDHAADRAPAEEEDHD